MTRNFARRLAAIAAATLCAGATHAAQLVVTSYNMPNGDGQANGGTYNYWDTAYTGSGATTTDRSALTGGTGKLTDGVIATQPWYNASNIAGTGSYVGWLQSPTITFHFAGAVDIDEVKLYVDNSHVGGVYAPDEVTIGGNTFANPGWASASAPMVLDYTGLGFHGDTLTITLDSPVAWVFMSEAQFFDNAGVVPEPGNVALMLAGVSVLGFLARRRRG